MKVLSVHLPRTGGTSLWGEFSNALGKEFLADYDHDPLGENASKRLPFPDRKRILHGHFRPYTYQADGTYLVTFLRHPVSLVLSFYCFLKNWGVPSHELHKRLLKEQPSVVQFARWPQIQRLASQTYFGDFDMHRFDFIGSFENRAADLKRLGAELGLALEGVLHDNRLVKDAERERLKSDPALQSELAELLREDIVFYYKLITPLCH